MGIRAVLMACGWVTMSCHSGATGLMHATRPPQAPQVETRNEPQAAKVEDHGKTKTNDSSADLEKWQISSSPLRFRDLGRSFLQDQKQIWTSPMRLRFSDTEWLVPLAGISAGLLVTDRDVSSHLSHDPATLSHYSNFLMPASGHWWAARLECGF